MQPNKADVSMQQSKAPVARGRTADPQLRTMQQVGKSDACNHSSVHPVRACGDENLDSDSSRSSFEFHNGEKAQRHSRSRYLSARPMPSKWNDAEKWILNKQNMQLISTSSKKSKAQNRVNLLSAGSVVGAAQEFLSYEIKPSVKRADLPRPAPRTGPGKFVFSSTAGVEPNTGQGKRANALIDMCISKDVIEVADAGIPAIRSAAMRDMGTEMTPIPSQEPSRSPTPVGATTPLRSPTPSPPSSPQTRGPAPIPTELSTSNAARNLGEYGGKELSEQEAKQRVTREIVALGVHLGKMNIVAWASKDERERNIVGNKVVSVDEGRTIECMKRAAAWEEAKRLKHEARFKREEMRVRAWESRQKAKSEEETRRTEAKIEQIRAKAQAKIAKKMASARRKVEEMRAAAEARRCRKHKKIAVQAKYICRTGRIPSSYFSCYWWNRRSRD
ncbi:hypothetical protein C2S52_014264 [Perilla frutescens var. hirtella]|nr:hypothetical protein C2S52_014264 [Perilla frutescens var. hirtella]